MLRVLSKIVAVSLHWISECGKYIPVRVFTYFRVLTVSPPPESLPYPKDHSEFVVPIRSIFFTRITSPPTELSSI